MQFASARLSSRYCVTGRGFGTWFTRVCCGILQRREQGATRAFITPKHRPPRLVAVAVAEIIGSAGLGLN